MYVILIEEQIINDGLFVTTRSGKGGDGDSANVIEDVDASLKRKARSIFEDMVREDSQNEEMLRKRQRIDSVCLFFFIMTCIDF